MSFDGDGERFLFRSATTVSYADPELSPVVERFCSEIARRTGLRLAPVTRDPASDAPSVKIELASGDELMTLPAPIGLSPTGDAPADERHSVVIDPDQVVVRAVEPVGVARALTTLIQLLASRPSRDAGEISVGARILDAPTYAWRGLSLDVARAFLTVDEIRRVIDLLELYKLNLLHLHLTDDQGWRLPMGRATRSPESDTTFYGADDLRALVVYARDRFVTVVPEVDTPGHVHALVRMRPELNTGRNAVEFQLPPGGEYRTAWLDPELPATFELMEEVLAGVAEIFPSPYVHIGGDEPHWMPHDLYSSYVRRVRRLVRSLGKRPLGWQETARAGLGKEDVIQYWYTEIALAPSLPAEVRAQAEANIALSRRDVEAAVAAPAPTIVSPLSHCYLDVPYAEPSAHPVQEARRSRVGMRFYRPHTVAESFEWEPSDALGSGRAAHVAGVEAAIWGETISDFDDLSFLLLPRLAGIAHKAWSVPHGDTWTVHRDRLARHGRLWGQDDLTYFRASTVDWA